MGRVGLHHDGTRDDAGEALHVGTHAVGAKPAVETERIHAQPLQERGDARHIAAREERAVLPQRDGGDHGQVAILLRGKDGGLELVGVAHRLDHHEVGTRRRAEAYLLGEGVVSGVELEVAGGLQETARGADVEGDEV